MKSMSNTEQYTMLRNGIQMPLLGLGVMHMHGNTCVGAVCHAVEVGYRMIDTAAIYGNESDVGRGIRICGIHNKAMGTGHKLRSC